MVGGCLSMARGHHTALPTIIVSDKPGSGKYPGSKLLVVVNESKHPLALLDSNTRPFAYVAPKSHEKLPVAQLVSSFCGEYLRVCQGTTGCNMPFMTVDLRVSRSVTVTNIMCRLGGPNGVLSPLQRRFRRWRSRQRAKAAATLQAVMRGFLARSTMRCPLCFHAVPRAQSYVARVVAPGTDTCRATDIVCHSGITRAYRRFCRSCVQGSLRRAVLCDQQVDVRCPDGCGAAVPEGFIFDEASAATRAKYVELVDRREAMATRIQPSVRGWLARRPEHCAVCLEDVPRALMVNKLHGSESCACCIGCLRGYLDTVIKEGRLHIRCPLQCPAQLQVETVMELASPDAARTHALNRQKNHKAYAEQLRNGVGDRAFIAWCSGHVRQCPSCGVLIYRYAGCNSMQCVCGAGFQWLASPDIQLPAGVSADEMAVASAPAEDGRRPVLAAVPERKRGRGCRIM